ncbi:MAG TPA: 2-oxo acid dehydrogenase subunit E2 [Anaerolineales bacterium]
MKKSTGTYQVIDFPIERRAMPAVLELKAGKHVMYALLEVDVTVARKYIEDYEKQTGEKLSFTGYLIYCLARAVDEDKTVQAYRKGKKQLVIFDDVDVGFMIELQKGGKHVLTGHVIRGANHKTYREIHQEIRTVQSTQVPTSAESATWFRNAILLPWPLSRLFIAIFQQILLHNPAIATSLAGTVGISSVGMFGKGHSGWGISSGTHVLDLTVGGTSRKPREVEGKVEGRDILCLTVLFDHDVIDGAPAARFTHRLVELIEGGYGLDEVKTMPEKDSQPSAILTG